MATLAAGRPLAAHGALGGRRRAARHGACSRGRPAQGGYTYMPQLPIRGRVIHGVPDWSGVALPCVNATVRVYDLDEGGNGNDEIFKGKIGRASCRERG